jgi:hypothetical protein
MRVPLVQSGTSRQSRWRRLMLPVALTRCLSGERD